MSELYISMKVRKDLSISAGGMRKYLPCSDLDDDCIGVALVYSNKEAALADAGEFVTVRLREQTNDE